MQFWNPLKKILPQREKPGYFLALILGDRKVQALVFERLMGKVEILGRETQNFSSTIEEIEQEELIEVCDRAIAGAEENLPPNISTSKAILGLKDDWISQGVIKKEYLNSLKKLKEELELEFLGFVIITEAVCHLLQKEEGIPPTSILVGKENQVLTVALVQGGHLIKLVTKRIDEENCAQILERILRTFKDYEVFPSRITLFGEEEDLEETRQELISFPWTKTLPFLHFPKIEVLEPDFVGRAVVAGFATQMGMEFEIEESALPASKGEERLEETFGFVKEKDVREEKELPPKEAQKIVLPRFRLPQFKLPERLPIRNLRYLFLLPIVILIFLILVYIFLPRATITLYVTPKNIEIEREVIIDPNIKTTALGNGRIKATEVSVEVSDSLEGQATGKKEVGEKAKGEVTIYNKSFQSITLAAGTVITSQNNLKFTLDDKITIASASGDVFSITTPSKEKMAVTAVQVGEESNFPSGTTFSFGNLTNVAAKNDNAFSGGSKKEVTMVSRADQENLTKALLEKLAKLAEEDILKDKSQEMQKIIDAALTQEILEKKFSKNIEEETNKFSLSLKVKFKTLSFNQDELKNLFETQTSQAVPGDSVLKPGGMTFSFGKTKLNKDKSVSSTVLFQATLLPKIEEKNIKNKIKAKSLEEASQILTTIPNVTDYKIKVSPVLPLLPKILPLRIENIRIDILEKNA